MSIVASDTDFNPARRKALRYFNLLRLVVAGFFLMAGARVGFGFEAPAAFYVAVVVYLIAILLLGFPDTEDRVGFGRLMIIQGLADVIVLDVVLWTSGGYSSGISALMMIMLAGLGLVAEGRTVLAMASLATISLLVETVQRAVLGHSGGEFFHVGLTSLAFFGIALMAQLLAQRAKTNAGLAAARGEELAHQEAINAHIISEMTDGVIVVGADGVVLHANRSASVLLDEPQIEGCAIAKVDPRLAEFCRAGSNDVGQLVEIGQARRLLRCRVAGGVSGIKNDVLVYLTDLEDIQRRMQQLKLASLGRLTASMAHEIRNPLSAVIQAAELLQEEKRSDMQVRLARIVKDNASRIERMIRDVLALGRREQAQPVALPLAAVVDDIIESRILSDPAERAVYSVHIDPEVTLGVDPSHLHQILDNLLGNARRYCSGQAGAIEIVAETVAAGQVCLHVRDDGPGVRDTVRANLFEPFFTSHPKGTGLGLYIARELAEANGLGLELAAHDPVRPGAHFILTGRSQP